MRRAIRHLTAIGNPGAITATVIVGAALVLGMASTLSSMEKQHHRHCHHPSSTSRT